MNVPSTLFKSSLRIILLVLIFSNSLIAQVAIPGVVTDDQQIPMPGVSVIIKGSSNGTTTSAG
ncbi:MAG: hypothetical protein WKF68_12155 [Daejeonella sp.]